MDWAQFTSWIELSCRISCAYVLMKRSKECIVSAFKKLKSSTWNSWYVISCNTIVIKLPIDALLSNLFLCFHNCCPTFSCWEMFPNTHFQSMANNKANCYLYLIAISPTDYSLLIAYPYNSWFILIYTLKVCSSALFSPISSLSPQNTNLIWHLVVHV